MLLRAEPSLRSVSIPASDSRIKYSGSWFRWTTVEEGDTNELPRATQTKGNCAELTFQGTGVEYIAQKTSGLGNADVYVDGHWRSSANLDLSDSPVFFNVVMFSVSGLARGDHSISVVNTGNSRNLEGFRVFQ